MIIVSENIDEETIVIYRYHLNRNQLNRIVKNNKTMRAASKYQAVGCHDKNADPEECYMNIYLFKHNEHPTN